MKHGLTSRMLLESLSDKIDDLAQDLIKGFTPTHSLILASEAAASSILILDCMRKARLSIIDDALTHLDGPGRDPRDVAKVQRLGFGSDLTRPERSLLQDVMDEMDPRRIPARRRRAKNRRDALAVMMWILQHTRKAMTSIQSYEDKALSRRAKALRHLDHMKVDALRAEAHQRKNKS